MRDRQHPIPFQFDERPDLELDQLPTFEAIGVNVVGHVVSPRGVELIAVDGDNNKFAYHDMTSVGWLFHTYLTPPKATLRLDAGPEAPMPRSIFLPPNVPIQWRSEPSVNAICLFGPDFIDRITETETNLGFASLDCVVTDQTDRLVYLSDQILREAVAPGFASGLLAEAIGMELALEIIRCDRAHRPDDPALRGGLAPRQMRRLESYVHAYLSDDLALPDLADLISVGTRYLTRVIERDKGVSVDRWIASLRITEAERLLVETNLGLPEIARRVAFKDVRTFFAAFQTARGLAPDAYRRLVRER